MSLRLFILNILFWVLFRLGLSTCYHFPSLSSLSLQGVETRETPQRSLLIDTNLFSANNSSILVSSSLLILQLQLAMTNDKKKFICLFVCLFYVRLLVQHVYFLLGRLKKHLRNAVILLKQPKAFCMIINLKHLVRIQR